MDVVRDVELQLLVIRISSVSTSVIRNLVFQNVKCSFRRTRSYFDYNYDFHLSHLLAMRVALNEYKSMVDICILHLSGRKLVLFCSVGS